MKRDVRYIVRGAVVGAVVGAIAGLLLGTMGDDNRAADQRPLDTSRAIKAGLGVLALVRQLVDL
ncbi:MAG: hypothetical protein ACOX2R_00145 [Anaerolineae bacterium]